MANWSENDIKLYKKLEGIIKRGYYISGNELADLHNKVFGTNLKGTGCTSCNKMRFQDLKKSYEKIMKEMEEGNEKEKDK